MNTAIELAELQPPLFDMHPMRVLALMTKSSYRPPALKDKIKWSPYFHDFVKQCLVKNPKKRPMPDKLLLVCFESLIKCASHAKSELTSVGRDTKLFCSSLYRGCFERQILKSGTIW